MSAYRSSRLMMGLFNGVMVLGLAAAFWGTLQVWQKKGRVGEVAAAPPVIIFITNNGFEPETFLVSVGESVTWRNDTSVSVEIGSSRHCYQYMPLLVGGEGEGSGGAAAPPSNFGNSWQSGPITPGATYSTVFASVGDYLVYLDCRTDVSGTIMVRSATPTPLPTHTYTPVPTAGSTATFTPGPSLTPSPTGPTPGPSHTPGFTATNTPGPSPTLTPFYTPTPTIGPTPTPTVPGPCGIWFEGPVFAGDQFVPVTGELSAPAPIIVELYAVLGSSNDLIAQAELVDVGPGHACPGHAVFNIDPSQFVLVANMLLIAVNPAAGTSDFTFVLPVPPTP